MSENGNRPHGPHGPGCKCGPEAETLVAGMALTEALGNLLPGLMRAWKAGKPGVTVDLRFERGREVGGIAVHVRDLDPETEWPEETADPDAMMAELEAREKRLVH